MNSGFAYGVKKKLGGFAKTNSGSVRRIEIPQWQA
jgi:hypothetical protein